MSVVSIGWVSLTPVYTHDGPVPDRVLAALGQLVNPYGERSHLVGSGSAFAHVTDRPCRECDGTGLIHIDMNEEPVECLECCATGWELE